MLPNNPVFLVHGEDINKYGLHEAVFLAYLTALTAYQAAGIDLGRTWVPLSSRAIVDHLGSNRERWRKTALRLVELGVIERRPISEQSYEYYYKNPRLERIVERMKTIRGSMYAWSQSTQGKKLSKEEHDLVLSESYAALERGEPLSEIRESLVMLLASQRKGKKHMDYETARYLAVEKPKGPREDRSPKSPRPKEVIA